VFRVFARVDLFVLEVLMSISKKLRFEVFKRDGFTCQYCGRTPPEAILEVDHFKPKSKKGKDDINNLVTSCFDCNRGKSNREVSQLPPTLIENIEVIKEKEIQVAEYNKLLSKIKSRETRMINKIANIYKQYFAEHELTNQFKEGSLRNFIKLLPYTEVEESMHQACSKIHDQSQSAKYFCGICWRKIKGDGKYHAK